MREEAECDDEWDALLQAHRAGVCRWCHRFLQDADAAEDAAQDVLLKAVAQRRSFRGEASLATWLHRIARNHCLNLLRRRNGHALSIEVEAEAGREAVARADPIGGAESRILYQQILEAVMTRAGTGKPLWDALDYLIFEAYYGPEPRSFVEIAAIVGRDQNVVKYRFYHRLQPTLHAVAREFCGDR